MQKDYDPDLIAKAKRAARMDDPLAVFRPPMGGRARWRWVHFGFNGQLGIPEYRDGLLNWLLLLVIVGLSILAGLILGMLVLVFLVPLVIAQAWIGYALLVKRMRDMGLSPF